jgi:hypothetical protein
MEQRLRHAGGLILKYGRRKSTPPAVTYTHTDWGRGEGV